MAKEISRKIKVNLYALLEDAVERGAQYGYMRAFKYTETPSTEHVISELVHHIMLEITDVIDFEQ